MAKKKSKAKAKTSAYANQPPEAAVPLPLKKAIRKRTRNSRNPNMAQQLQPVGGPAPKGKSALITSHILCTRLTSGLGTRTWLKLPEKALMKAGFDPAVCTKTAEEVLLEWAEQSKLFMKRPSKKKYYAGKGRANIGQYSYGRIFTEVRRRILFVETRR